MSDAEFDFTAYLRRIAQARTAILSQEALREAEARDAEEGECSE